MENNNYYPLRVGKYPAVIVSDTFPNERATRYKKSEMDSEWEHYGGFIIAESVPPEMAQKLVDAYNEKYAPKEDSGHSFNEGMQIDLSIDAQIKFIKNRIVKYLKHPDGAPGRMYQAIIENLKAIKRWNETPVYHGEIDVAKVIFDLMDAANIQVDTTELVGSQETKKKFHTAMRNAQITIDMINRFKEEREAGMAPREAPDWVKKHAHVKTKSLTAKDVTMRDYIPQVERDLLVNDLMEMLPFDRSIARKTANTIVTAIESMDHLKRKHGR